MLLALAGCTPEPGPPPPALRFEGLVVSGSRVTAGEGGFGGCIADNVSLRCLRDDVRIVGQGPYRAAVELAGSDGAGGFDEVTLWHDTRQAAVLAVGNALLAQGWTLCRTGQEDRGDQLIYTKAGSPVRVSIDASYWNKRRVRIMPERGQPTGRCW